MRKLLKRLTYRLIRTFNALQTRKLVVRFAETEAELRQVWKMNFETFGVELNQDALSPEATASGMLPDPLQDHSKYILAYLRDELIGVLILTLPTGRFSIESSLTDPTVLDGRRDQTIEYRRLAVKKEHRGRGVFLRMGDFSLAWAIPAGYRLAIMSAIDRHIGTYSRLGFHAFDRPFTKGACTYQPMMCSIDDFISPSVEKEVLPLAHQTVRELKR